MSSIFGELTRFAFWAIATELVVLLLAIFLRETKTRGVLTWILIGTLIAGTVGYAAQVGEFSVPL